MIKRVSVIALALILMFLSASCGKDGEIETNNDDPAVGSTIPDNVIPDSDSSGNTEGKDTENIDDFIFPSEGVRPYAVMIDNQGKKCLPQGGLDKAQIVYEIIVEGGLTRLMPVFWGINAEMIGPVRSSRHYFLDYAMEHDALYVHFGWSIRAFNDIKELKINNIDGFTNAGSVFWDLTKDKSNWQDTYTSTKKLDEFSKKVGYRTSTGSKPVLEYNSTHTQPSGGKIAEKINIRYSTSYFSGYEYDAKTKRYLRFKEGEPQMERVSGKQLAACNIIIQYVKNYTIKGDDAGRQDLVTAGSGKGILITSGKAEEIKWSKDSRSAPTKYTYPDGTGIRLNPGQTWIQIVPLGAKIGIE